jgi:SAM-dependent methyltransferase
MATQEFAGPQSDEWRRLNRANWDERVAIHVASGSYDLTELRAGRARLHAIEEAEFGPVEGLRIVHLQCHFGRDTLTLAQQGAAAIVGLDFSAPAIAVACRLAAELGLEDRARFVESDLYAAPAAIGEPGSFDRVFVTWGAINWLPDIREWARIAASFLKPGGALYLAEGHPSALVFENSALAPGESPNFDVPYFPASGRVAHDATDYADDSAVLSNARTWWWNHTLGDIVSAIAGAGLRVEWLHEHDAVPWKMFDPLVTRGDRLYRWPAERWLPLAFSLLASRPR